MSVDPLDVECPACFAKPHRQCTQPDDTGRHEVKRAHWSRIARAEHGDG